MDFTVETATDAVLGSFRETEDQRLRQVMESPTRHFHNFVREIEPAMEELLVPVAVATDAAAASWVRRTTGVPRTRPRRVGRRSAHPSAGPWSKSRCTKSVTGPTMSTS